MQILIQHISGSKANRTDHFDTDSVSEITFGRDTGSTVAYDATQDDDVSRLHATLRVRQENGIAFLLRDNNSTNGTRVNGRRITDEVQLAPEDKVELGLGGPTFIFDVQPRPPSMMAKTRVIGSTSISDTRVITSAPPPTAARTPAASTVASARPGIGRDTVMGLLQQERQATSRLWMIITALIVAVIGAGGGALYWRMTQDKQQTATELAAANNRTAQLMQTQQAQKDTQDLLQQKVGVTPNEIVRDYAMSTVKINVHWRLYDKVTGKPAFQKVVTRKDVRYRAYVRMPDQKLVPWLTTDGEGGTNSEMQVTGTGSGFLVNEDGFIITNKHVAAGWLVHYVETSDMSFIIYDLGKKEGFFYPNVNEMMPEDRLQIQNWIPSDSVYMFDSRFPYRLDSSTEGRNDLLEVQFPGGSRPISARLIRTSAEADIALVKIDMPKKLPKVQIAPGVDPPAVGGAITVLGYPCTCMETVRLMTTNEAGDVRQLRDTIPEPTVVAGTIARLSDPIMQKPGEVLLGSGGDLYVLNAAADHGNSGGPVFDSTGNVIAVLTYGSASRETTTFAVPIKYATELLE
jgi:S1-C subfamily serine protease